MEMNHLLEHLVKPFLFIYYWLEGMILALIPRRFRYKELLPSEVVLITGGGSGIGRLLALRFARLGCSVVIWDVNKQGNEETTELVANDGGKCYSYVCDVTDRQMVYKMAEKVKKEVGPVTILINNAGIVSGKKFLDIPDSLIEKTFQVNSLAHFWTCKAFLPDMITNDYGHIVTISSLAGLTGGPKLTDYCSSKFAAIGFHESLCLELKKFKYDGIQTTLVCPFFTNTGLFGGIETGYFKLLEPDYVADEIVSAVLTNQMFCIVPNNFVYAIISKFIFPSKATIFLFESLKGDIAMDNFVGRNK